jgi:hypothetical protein
MNKMRAMDVLKYSDLYHRNANDPDKFEYFVPVKWLETRSEQDAVNEVVFLVTKIRSASPPRRNGVTPSKN